jgi:hypothetical protein
MRLAGLILVILGALTLGLQCFDSVSHRSNERNSSNEVTANEPVSLPLVMSGIAVTSGLLMLTAAAKWDQGSRLGRSLTPS